MFGDCLVHSLSAVSEDAQDGFAEKYLEMLRAGGTLRHKELLAPFGLDATDPAFWQKGLAVIADFVDQIEAMEEERLLAAGRCPDRRSARYAGRSWHSLDRDAPAVRGAGHRASVRRR